MYNTWQELIISNFSLGKESSRGWHSLSCPVCRDRKKRAAFKFTPHGFGYNCFRGKCGFKLRVDEYTDPVRIAPKLNTLFSSVGLKEDEWSNLLFEAREECVYIEHQKPELKDPEEIKLPFGATKLLDANPNSAVVGWAIDYLLDRDVDPATNTFYITTAHPPKDALDFRNRLIIPFYYKNKLIFYQAPWIHPTRWTKIKYLNTNLVERDTIFYNMDELDRDTDDPIFVVEGVFDARWYRNAVGTLSNTLTEQQILRLNACHRRKIVIPDNDKAGVSIVSTAITENWDVSFPDWFGVHKDVDDAVRKYGKIRVLQEIMNSIKQTTFEKEIIMEFLRSVE